jgi:hypothetical protein
MGFSSIPKVAHGEKKIFLQIRQVSKQKKIGSYNGGKNIK